MDAFLFRLRKLQAKVLIKNQLIFIYVFDPM